jgi:hypothetical protein
MALVLNRAQRDAVYRFVVSDLARAGGVAVALEEGEVAIAERLRRQFDQAVRVLDQIEWIQAGSRDRYEVALAAADAQGIFERLHEDATRVINEAITEFADAVLKEAFSVAEVSGTVLGRHTARPARPQLRAVQEPGSPA